MILDFVEMFSVAAVKTLLVGMPESAGLLIFGIVLVVTAVLIRRLLGRNDEGKADEKLGKKVL